MTATVHYFALIGRSFPSDAFKALHAASLTQREERRLRPGQDERRWRASDEPIIVPARLIA